MARAKLFWSQPSGACLARDRNFGKNEPPFAFVHRFDHEVNRDSSEMDDGKILAGKPDLWMMVKTCKNPWVSGVDFPQQTNPLRDSSEIMSYVAFIPSLKDPKESLRCRSSRQEWTCWRGPIREQGQTPRPCNSWTPHPTQTVKLTWWINFKFTNTPPVHKKHQYEWYL